MQGKICLITGANRGIGRATAEGLARMGATVLVVCRTKATAEQTCAQIAMATGNGSLQAFSADFGVQAEVRALVADIVDSQPRLDVLINNAGTYFSERTITVDGVEATFATNHLAPFILTNGLSALLKQSAPSRVIMVASQAHQRVRDPEDWQSAKSYHGVMAYARSKLANVIFAYDQAQRLMGSGVTVNSLHPGVVSTNILEARFHSWWSRWAWPVFKQFLITPGEGAKGTLNLATSPELHSVTGEYFNQLTPARSSLVSRDPAIRARLWQTSLRLTGELPSVNTATEGMTH